MGSESVPGQTATWRAGEQMSGQDPEPDSRWPSWFVAYVPEANIELSAILRTGGGQHFFYKKRRDQERSRVSAKAVSGRPVSRMTIWAASGPSRVSTARTPGQLIVIVTPSAEALAAVSSI